MAEATYAQKSRSAAHVARPTVWSGSVRRDQRGESSEQEADEIADLMMRSQTTVDVSGSPDGACCSGCASGGGCDGEVQRQAASSQASAGSATVGPQQLSADIESRIRGSSTGRPLPGPTRASFEPRFGHDLSNVRVYADAEAARFNDDMQAYMFTHGTHVRSASGVGPKPSRVLAHVVQHAGSAVPGFATSGMNAPSGLDNQTPLPGILQPKLVVGTVDDPLEREADRIADQVMHFPASALPITAITAGSPQLRRQCACGSCEEEASQTLRTVRAGSLCSGNERDTHRIVDEVLRSPGRPLDTLVRNDMEQRFGHDFSRVRLHTDMLANASARATNAHAYTVGHDIVFGTGRFAPDTAEGIKLIAHELVHVVQQGEAANVMQERVATAPWRRFEHKDDRTAACPSANQADKFMPRLSSALRLQRQLCNRADDKIVTDPLVTKLPDITCQPDPKTLQEVRAEPDAPKTLLGLTESVVTTDQVSTQELKASRCSAHVKSFAEMKINKLIYAKEGIYDDGTEETPAHRACAQRKVVAKKMQIRPDAAKKIREGEIEHCEDKRLAFALSWGKYNQAIRDLEGDYCAAGAGGATEDICSKEFAQRFKNRTGIEFEKRRAVADCLLDKTKLRDSEVPGWHIAVPTSVSYAQDCSAVTYTYTAQSLPEVGKHPSAEIVKGCGEK
jgi:hypothetical protein